MLKRGVFTYKKVGFTDSGSATGREKEGEIERRNQSTRLLKDGFLNRI